MGIFFQNIVRNGMMIVATTNTVDVGEKIANSIQWLVTGGGLLMAVWGIIQVVSSGRMGDSTGKMEGSWLILGGVLLIGLGAGTMLTGIFSNPPGM